MNGFTRRSALGALGASGGMFLGSGGSLAAALQPPIVLRDLGVDAAFLPAGIVIDLDRDLVRQWRDTLRSQIMLHLQTIAIVRWDRTLTLSGLGREEGLAVTYAPLANVAGLFRVRLTRS